MDQIVQKKRKNTSSRDPLLTPLTGAHQPTLAIRIYIYVRTYLHNQMRFLLCLPPSPPPFSCVRTARIDLGECIKHIYMRAEERENVCVYVWLII